jgi:hypothetical protein
MPLAAEGESENDVARNDCNTAPYRIVLSVEARLQRQQNGFPKMINTFGRAAVRCLLAAVMSVAAASAFAQPTEAQREAVKTDCRSDYIAHCSSVPPGGEAALQCLAKNMSSLSSTCQAAVRAVEASVAKPATAPAATNAKPAAAPTAPAAAPKAATTTTAKQPSSAQVSAIRAACQSDYPKVCVGVPPGGAAALQCLDKNKAKVSAPCQQAVNAATGGGAAPAAGGAAAAPAAAATAQPAPLVLRRMLPREELFVTRSACAADIGTLCQGVVPGGGRIMQCLSARSTSLSSACRDVLAPFAVQ